MSRTKKLPENYFKFVNPIIISLIGVLMYLLLMAWLDPRNISATYFGRVAEFATWLGTENNHLMKQMFLVTVAVHIAEAMIAVYLCHKLKLGSLVTIAWTVQTLLCGIFSLYSLIWPAKPPKQEKSQDKSSASKKSKQQKSSKQSDGKQQSNVKQRSSAKKEPNAKQQTKAKQQPNAQNKKSKAKKEK